MAMKVYQVHTLMSESGPLFSTREKAEKWIEKTVEDMKQSSYYKQITDSFKKATYIPTFYIKEYEVH